MTELRSEPYFSDADVEAERDAGVPRHVSRKERRRRRTIAALAVLLVVLAAAAVVSIVWQPGAPVATAPVSPAEAPRAATAAPEARYPVPPTQAAQPPLEASDATMLAGLALVFGDGALSTYIEPQHLARRIVATVDNLPRRSATPAQWPVKPAAGALATVSEDGRTRIAEANGFRYTAYVRLLESVDVERFAEFYRRHYPLFQQAYRELGYPQGHFNDRAVEAIDVLMATPTLAQSPALVQPKIFLQFADRDLEQLPAGQKLMLRLGAQNAARVKAKLADIRTVITAMEVHATR
ncbi:MAG TPA: DUF3014 domain-containing protein [Casimicrobiaceae bacterium]|nr:DUF3014 domain-containing protein [Casimicrobiaceae bacterium]